MYHIGLDIGSTTLKMAVKDQDNKVVYQSYKRHRSFIRDVAMESMQEIIDVIGNDAQVTIAVTGSAGMGFAEQVNLPFIQEVVATQLAVENQYDHIDVVIELGGEDAKILFLTGGTEVRMNGSCAGGTGAFIDQMAVLLDTDLASLDKLSLQATHIYPIASRCGVFAKTDIQPLLNQGAAKADVAMSIFHAVVNQTIGGLAQGREIHGNVMFLGGPLTFLKGLQKAFQDVLTEGIQDYIFPDNAQYFVAYGASLYSRSERVMNAGDLFKAIEEQQESHQFESHVPPLFTSQAEYDAFVERHNKTAVPRGNLESYTGNSYLGIDAGSTTVKLILIGEKQEILYEVYEASNGRPVDFVRKALLDIYRINPNIKIASGAVTGYGEDLVKTALQVDDGLVETMAHLTAAQAFLPDVDFIIDIGGQDMKCFRIKDGVIDTIFLNEACSSGCGSFISTFASALGYSVADFAKLGLFAEHPVELGSRCTVFMNSSVKQAQKEGASVEDISAGLSMSVVKNALYKVIRVNSAEDLGKHIVVQGGTFYNDAILRSFEQEIGGDVIRPEIAGLMGAYGCALFAKNRPAKEKSSILDKEALENFEQITDTRICDLCGNHCQLTVNRFSGGRELIAGNRCERPLHKDRVAADKLPNQMAYKRQLINQARAKGKRPLENRRGTIGIPLGLNIYEMYPFWMAFWRALRFQVILSPFGSKDIYLSGQSTIPSDTVCYPAKLMHGQMAYLLKQGVDAIFYPCLTYNFDENISDNHYNCPVVAYYPQVLDANMKALRDVQFLFPFYGVHNRKRFTKTIVNDMRKIFNIPVRETKEAVEEAFSALEDYHQKISTFGEDAIAKARDIDAPIIVLAGRPYHIDPEINHGIDQLIESFKAAVITEDALPMDPNNIETDVLNQWTYHARLYNAAKVVREEKDMYLIQLVSFGCGLDAITTDEVRDILDEKNDIYTQIKIDEINNLGAVRIRLRSLFATIEEQNRRDRSAIKEGEGSDNVNE